MENRMAASQKIENRAATRFGNPNSGYIFIGYEISISNKYLQSHSHCSTTHNSQDVETT
jgi:hypothetical protein